MPPADAYAAFTACFADLDDPRADNIRHLLHEILLIAFCAVLCGAEDPCDMALFGHAKEDYFRQFLRLPHGIPSHDTFSRRFRLLDPARFQACFLQFMQRFAEDLAGGSRWTARLCAAPLTAPRRSRLCTWSAPGPP